MTAPPAPQLEYAFSVTITLEKVYWVKPTSLGAARAGVYLKDGIVEGPKLNGRVIERSGADWPLQRPNGVIDFDARYMFELDDGTIVYVQNRGYRWGTEEAMAAMARREEVGSDSYYFRVSPKFDAPDGPHEWLSRHVFVGVAEKTPRGNVIHYYQVL
ncbi:MAG: DUF3237 family protein [Caulobacteraceae bacterium]